MREMEKKTQASKSSTSQRKKRLPVSSIRKLQTFVINRHLSTDTVDPESSDCNNYDDEFNDECNDNDKNNNNNCQFPNDQEECDDDEGNQGGEHLEDTILHSGIQIIERALSDLKFSEYMRSTLGGKKSNKDSNAIQRQYSTFLCWSYVSTNENPPRMKSDVRQWMVDVIRTNYALVSEFCQQHLEIAKRMAPATVLHYLSAISYSSKWFISFCRYKHGLVIADMSNLLTTIKMVRTAFAKDNNKHRQSKRFASFSLK
jgi:hypothetical protein